ncbi:IS5 family transposase [Cupriavidus nantongensis]|uniref:Transposase n=1 Tax=Cupriavidus nantongensis TaxID=1796606 RepID=A0A142JP20_9BURK|nr:IS5 family transposase [Cupriavidus nantongensis]AMR78324.1 transposase [Cupriavidus nantongensis]AMR78415.1 transposase [Cupriavidus nantongensis]AMR78556.1 transposase [Cupriavidus nantongensis]AMR79832.1 transposase [Cupriavidus nantongensis]AMR79991.1 transposase [Cupriavidus nantongensis]
MRGADTFTESLFTMRRLDDFVPKSHPLRSIRAMANQALVKMDRLFAQMYEDDIKGGQPSIAPEKLLRAMLLQVLYSVRSERQLMEQTQYNLLFRWFIGLSMDDTVWVPTVFTKNRERLIKHDAVIQFFNEVLAIAQKKNWLSGEHFSVDGTLIQAWAGHKSFVRKDGGDDKDDNDGANFKGRTRSNETHESKTDPDAKLYRKGKTASELRYMGHTLSDNRHGLVVSAMVTNADGHAEREAAKVMLNDARQVTDDPNTEITVGADKGYDAQEFIQACLELKVTPHVAQNTSGRRSAVPDAIACSAGYAVSQQKRKLIEQGFGWVKTVGRMRQVMVRGLKRVDQMFVLSMAAYNLVRMRSLGQIRPQLQ